jgi:hypothetical protein
MRRDKFGKSVCVVFSPLFFVSAIGFSQKMDDPNNPQKPGPDGEERRRREQVSVCKCGKRG